MANLVILRYIIQKRKKKKRKIEIESYSTVLR